jgi:tripartite-type tricarboxylate transporter receptor subunit TctC
MNACVPRLREVTMKGIRRSLLAALSVAVLCVFATGAQAEFKASNVTVYIPSGIGGGYDAYARLAARHLGQFLPGNPAMVPKNMPGAGGVVLANYMYGVAPRDGSAVALFMAGAPFEPLFGNAKATYDPTRFKWLISLNRLVNIGIFWHQSPVRTPADFFKGEVLVGSSGGGDSSTEIYPNLLNLLAGTKFKVVSGYKGNGESMLAMERGEVYGIVGTELSSFRATKPDWIRDHKARIVVQITLTKSPDIPDVPSALDLVKDPEGHKAFELLLARQENGRSFALPPDTPADVVTVYRQAFERMVKDPAFLADAKRLNADIVVNSGAEILALLKKTYASPRPLVERAVAMFRKAGGH